MKKYLSTEKSKQKELSQPKTPKESSSSRKHEAKRHKYRNNSDSKWMNNGNNTWLEYRNINGIVHMFCKWYEAKNIQMSLQKEQLIIENKVLIDILFIMNIKLKLKQENLIKVIC